MEDDRTKEAAEKRVERVGCVASIFACTHSYSHTPTQPYKHTYIHTYIRTCMYKAEFEGFTSKMFVRVYV